MNRLARAAFLWSLTFGLLHFAWAFAYLWWPAFGSATLGPTFEQAFSRPPFMLYDLAVAVLFVFAALLALAVVWPGRAGFPRWMVTSGVWTAGVLLFLRGAAGVVVDFLDLAGLTTGTWNPFNFYDFWFLFGGSLFLATAWANRSSERSGARS